ncbi:MAG: alcohol dehydrogenase catalytic domain-containing protein [Polyangiaceae bacterium]
MLGLLLDDSIQLKSDLPEPARAAGEALVAVRLAGVCDTDLQLARGYMAFRGVPGHEFVGTVLEADDPSWRGKRVVADINAGCGVCEDCTVRDGHHCPSRTVLGILGRQGAFAERLTIPARCLVEVPAAVSDDNAVFAEPLAAALHVLDDAESVAGRVVVLGDGKLGQLIARALSRVGRDVTLVGHHEDKLRRARDAGVSAILERDAGDIRGAGLVVEATGSEGGLARAMELVRPRGTIVLKTTTARPHSVDLSPLVIHEIRLVGSRCGDLRAAVSLMARTDLDLADLIERRYPLPEAAAAVQHAARPGVMKVLIDVAG